jgi:Skp family chaperone for outer membrane proteins
MELKAEEDRISVELNILQKKIAAAEAGLGTLRPESSDYLELERDVRQKRDKYRLEKEYYEQLLGLKDRQWTKEFYEDILRVTGEVGKERGLDLVFERSEPDFSMVSATELLMTIQTHKLLYTGGCVDITDEVMAGLDKESTKAGTGGGK